MSSKTKFHPKLELIIDRHNRNKAALYVPNDDGIRHVGSKPLYLPAEQKEQEQRTEAAYRDELKQLAKDAERDAHDAGITLMRLNNPYRWLNTTEAAQAAAMAPFVKDDFQRAANVGELLALIRQAATGDSKAHRWLAYRYATERVEQLAKDGTFAREEITNDVLEAREALATRIAQLKVSLLSSNDKATYDAAKQRQREAVEIRDGVKMLSLLGAA